MEAQRDDVNVKGASETWGRLQRTRAEEAQLWATLFTEVATAAGLPAPRVQPAIASYEDRKHAAVLAEQLKTVLGVEVSQFTVPRRGTLPKRHCVSLP